MPRTIHIADWVNRATPDFFTLFIQSWIPYNAWYNAEIAPVAGKHDFECINYICNHSNVIKDKLITLLTLDNVEGDCFRRNIAALHHLLIQHPIPNALNKLTFSSIPQGSMAQTLQSGDYYNYHYTVERTPSGQENSYRIVIEDRRTHVTKYSANILRNQNFNVVENDPGFRSLTSAMQIKIRQVFAVVDPKAPCDVVLTPIQRGQDRLPPANCLAMDKLTNTFFINDTDKVAQVTIKLIYRLRCELFHGSIAITKANQSIFEYLYNIQSALIQELV